MEVVVTLITPLLLVATFQLLAVGGFVYRYYQLSATPSHTDARASNYPFLTFGLANSIVLILCGGIAVSAITFLVYLPKPTKTSKRTQEAQSLTVAQPPKASEVFKTTQEKPIPLTADELSAQITRSRMIIKNAYSGGIRQQREKEKLDALLREQAERGLAPSRKPTRAVPPVSMAQKAPQAPKNAPRGASKQMTVSDLVNATARRLEVYKPLWRLNFNHLKPSLENNNLFQLRTVILDAPSDEVWIALERHFQRKQHPLVVREKGQGIMATSFNKRSWVIFPKYTSYVVALRARSDGRTTMTYKISTFYLDSSRGSNWYEPETAQGYMERLARRLESDVRGRL